MCASLSQCRVEQLGGSIEPVELVLPKWSVQNPGFSLVSRARWSLAQAFPGLMAYQHLALIRKVA
jgi:hypothetical protein